MNPEDCKVGLCVWYEPSPGRKFLGIVAEDPWQLGHGTWVTKLRGMEPAYAEFTHKSGDKATTVFAAALCRLGNAGHSVDLNKMVGGNIKGE